MSNAAKQLREPALLALAAVEIVCAVLAWRDLTHREANRVRGPKVGWRVLICLNPGNSVAYWILGRRAGRQT